MRTPIRLPGSTRLATRALAVATALIVVAPLSGQAASAATPASVSHSVATRPATPAAAAPVTAPSAARRAARILSSTACTLSSGTYSCDLWAKAGTFTLPGGGTVPIWGYAATSGDPAGLPGPTLIVQAGNALSITLHNVDLPSNTSLSLPQQPLVPDTTGVAAGSDTTYTIAASDLAAGTYLYEAGLTGDGPRQVAMGMYGALIVRPASCGAEANCAYDANSGFDDEAVLVLSEIDPAFNAQPFTSNLSYFAPTYWLINGKSYPDTDPVATDAGRRVLLRYVNAGLVHHAMSVLGARQAIVAVDGKALANRQAIVDDTVPSGSAIDAIVSVPASAPAGTEHAVFESAMHLDNAGALSSPPASNPANTPIAFGGMLTFLTVAGSSVPSGGPVTSAVSLAPNPSNGSAAVTVAATVTSASSTVSAAEYFVDAIGATGAGCPIAGTFGSATASLSDTIPLSGATAPCVDLATLSSGTHTFYVHGQDAASVWGSVAAATLNLDKSGPAVGALLTPGLTNGAVAVSLQGTASDAATGGQNVVAAEYFVDPSGTPAPGTGTPIAIPTPAPDVAINATLGAASVAALTEGAHTIALRAQDAAGNWGTLGTVTLTLDKTGPNASAISATPNPTNGRFGVQIGSTGQVYERIDVTLIDPVSGGVSSVLAGAEYFIDTTGANGSGGAMLANDGVFNGPTEHAYGPAELFAIAALPQGSHTIYVHGKDSAGNWGPFSTTTLVVDKTRPYITSAGVAPNPSGGAASVTLSVATIDVANINRIEYFIGADPGQGNGIAITTTAPALPAPNVTGTATVSLLNVPLGTATISVRARNANSNWSAITTVTLAVTPLFADGFDAGTFAAWSTRGGNLARTTVSGTAAQAGGYGMAAQILSGSSGYVQDNTPNTELRYRARFYVNPNSVTLTNLTPYTVFAALNNGTSNRFTVELRRNGGQYQVRSVLTRNGGATASNWFNVATSSFTAVEVAWSRTGNNLSLSLYTGGVLAQTVAGVSTNATQGQYRIDTVRMGPQGSVSGASGTVLFDSFASTRTAPVIGL